MGPENDALPSNLFPGGHSLQSVLRAGARGWTDPAALSVTRFFAR
jgi:hypothetical protein